MQVIQVVQNGAAFRAALEKDDTIIAVNGFQVGYVNGTLYDCSTEFERLADQNGWVNLLVLDNRTRSLVNLPLQLDSRLRKIGGTLTWRDPVNLPARSVAVVEIRERTRVNAPTTVVARTEVNQFRPNAIPFEMEYDPGLIDPNRNYFVTAYVLTSNNQVLYQASPNSNYQLTNLAAGQTRPVTVAMERVTGGFDQPLVNNTPNNNSGRDSVCDPGAAGDLVPIDSGAEPDPERNERLAELAPFRSVAAGCSGDPAGAQPVLQSV